LFDGSSSIWAFYGINIETLQKEVKAALASGSGSRIDLLCNGIGGLPLVRGIKGTYGESLFSLGRLLMGEFDPFENYKETYRMYLEGKTDADAIKKYTGDGCVTETVCTYILLKALGIEARPLFLPDHVSLIIMEGERGFVMDFAVSAGSHPFRIAE